jgi:replicative DNA helicase
MRARTDERRPDGGGVDVEANGATATKVPRLDAPLAAGQITAESAERALLGAVLLGIPAPDALAGLRTDDFAVPEHRAVFAAIATVAKRGDRPDAVLVAEALRVDGPWRWRWVTNPEVFLAELTGPDCCPVPGSWPGYRRIVLEIAVRRRVVERVRELSISAESGSWGSIINELEKVNAELARLPKAAA